MFTATSDHILGRSATVDSRAIVTSMPSVAASRIAARCALAGLALSTGWSAAQWFGIDRLDKFGLLLLLGLMAPMPVTADIAHVILAGPLRRSPAREILAGAPPLALPVVAAALAYAMGNLALTALGVLAPEAADWRIISGCAMFLYALAWAANSARVRRGEHDMP